MTVRGLSVSVRRVLPPLVGLILSLVAYAAQNIWHLYQIQDVVEAVRRLEPAGLAVAVFLIGAVEGTVVLCFYVPGTAVLILLLLGLQPSWAEGLQLLGWMSAGTLLGYGLSIALGRGLQHQLPELVGRSSYERMRTLIERFGSLAFAVAAFHPNPLAVAFSIVGYLRVRRLGVYFGVTLLAQAVWWASYASSASLLSRQTVVTGSNFQLFLAALFMAWLVYELLPRRSV